MNVAGLAAAAAQLELRDIHAPPPPGWWPPAPGWWLLALLLLAASTVAVIQLRRRLRVQRERRRLRAAVAEIRSRHAGHGAALLTAASELLRRACKQHAPQALTLHGEAWLRFLDDGLAEAPFSTGPGRLLLDGPYRPAVDADAAEAVLALVERRLVRLPGASR